MVPHSLVQLSLSLSELVVPHSLVQDMRRYELIAYEAEYIAYEASI